MEKRTSPYLGNTPPPKAKEIPSNQHDKGVTDAVSPFSFTPPTESEKAKILGLGVDTLYLAGYVVAWRPQILKRLREGKAVAFKQVWPGSERKEDRRSQLRFVSDGEELVFEIQPSGKITNTEGPQGNWNYHLKNGLFDLFVSERAVEAEGESQVDEFEPKVCNAYAEVRSEALWRHGLEWCWETVERVLQAMALGTVRLQASRVDFCCDTTYQFKPTQKQLIVSRAVKSEGNLYALVEPEDASMDPSLREFETHRVFTGWHYPSKLITCRVYRKDIEIKKSGKTWQYEVHRIPQGTEFWRIEFTIRSGALRQFGISDLDSLLKRRGDVWAYLTGRWFSLRVLDDPRPSRRSFLRAWQVIYQAPTIAKWADSVVPAVREKATKTDAVALLQMVDGVFSSLGAIIGRDTFAEVLDYYLKHKDEHALAEFEQRVHQKKPRLRPWSSEIEVAASREGEETTP